MHVGKKFSLKEVIIWTRTETLIFLVIGVIPTALYDIVGIKWLSIPWLPIALVGTAVAFLVGFKNNATYDRLWEARKIWGGIVNASRTWGIFVRDFITARHAGHRTSEEELKQWHIKLIHRHVAWLTALRYQLRSPRNWEFQIKSNAEYMKRYPVPEWVGNLDEELPQHIDQEEFNALSEKKNQATQLISNQSRDLKDLLGKGLIEDFRHMELSNVLSVLYELQGKCERIKNFPYPRQFATINLYFIWTFILLVPFGMLEEFEKLGSHMVWLTVPFSILVSWIFHTMEKIGGATENPFQGGPNDIPMESLSRTIEIDLKEMLDEKDIPAPTTANNNILM